jgi:hypothetical protein
MFIRFDHAKHKFVWVAIIFVAVILIVGFFLSVSGKKIDYNSPEGLKTAGGLYLSWFANSFNNVKTLTGDAIKMDWTGNSSSSIKAPNK